jgi:nucleolar GTP-binding protein
MYNIPTVLTADELIDKAFKRASKITQEDRNKLKRIKNTSLSRINSISNTLNSTLGKYIKSFPSLEMIPTFYYELIDILVGIDKLKRSLGAIDWCRKTIGKVEKGSVRKIKRMKSMDEILAERRKVYGRVSSLIKQVSSDLLFLNDARWKLRKMPSIDANLKTIVIAGSPNVGKSQLVKQISSGKPKVAVYPFTTQNISIGHLEDRYQKYQIVDTPGLLDREFSERNPIEKQAVLALRHLADVVIFLIDPTETCGYEMKMQLSLLRNIKKIFDNVPMIEVENKADLRKTRSRRQKISALTGEGTDVLVKKVLELMQS